MELFRMYHRKNEFEIYLRELNEEYAIKVRSERGEGLRIATVKKVGGDVRFDNESNITDDTPYPNAWALFNANFKPEDQLEAAFKFFELVNNLRQK